MLCSSECETAVLESLTIRARILSEAGVLLSVLVAAITAVDDEMERLDSGKEIAEDDEDSG